MQKRGRTQNEFLQELSDALAETPKQEVERMPKTIVGKRYFEERAKRLVIDLIEDLVEEGALPTLASVGRHRPLKDLVIKDFRWSSMGLSVDYLRLCDDRIFIYLFGGVQFFKDSVYGCREEGFGDLIIYVDNKDNLAPLCRFAQAWEARSRSLKTSRDATATIIESYVAVEKELLFQEKIDLLVEKLAKNLIESGACLEDPSTKDHPREDILSFESARLVLPGLRVLYRTSGVRVNHWFKGIDIQEYSATSPSDGLRDLKIRVDNKKALPIVRKFARAWEAMSRGLEESRNATVTIVKNYA